ncbi:hypothetical protein KP79_PYT09379 [Mizuhopecten yessoensis]|uniref:Gamma-butyrobetaine hydroxylase-like N-terminal domain-containing protein n=1 Tax=Mizuhopecten yessoensis TaxID=6573 RepID=A0A210QS01_MIZYE|nr:hypothetical protein KP79_PYT09379 [Mizuhopecten yessoensis]
MNFSGVGRFNVTGQLYSAEVLNRYFITWWSSLSRQPCRCKATQKVICSSFHKAAASPSTQSELSRWRIYKPGHVTTRSNGTMHPQVGLSQGKTTSTQPKTLLCNNGQELVLKWHNGKDLRYHAVWLRYNCQCPECVQPHSGQRLLETTNVNPGTVIETAYFNGHSTPQYEL